MGQLPTPPLGEKGECQESLQNMRWCPAQSIEARPTCLESKASESRRCINSNKSTAQLKSALTSALATPWLQAQRRAVEVDRFWCLGQSSFPASEQSNRVGGPWRIGP